MLMSITVEIIIKMYFKDDEQHHTPHFHAAHAGSKAVFDLDGNLIFGIFPPRQTKYVVAWADIHRDELTADSTIVNGDNNPALFPIGRPKV